jgi:CRISPR type IV-associated protein Csf2
MSTRDYGFRGVVTALTSIVHGGDETFGTVRTLHREKFVMPDGSVEEIPTITGNSLRGQLRDCAMVYMMRTLNLRLSPGAFDFLTSGGALSKVGNARAIDIQQARDLRENIPAVSVFGGAAGNRILRGKLRMGKLIPICLETAHLIPDDVRDLARASIWDMLQIEGYTRTDDKKNETLRALMQPEQLALIEAESESLDEANVAARPGVKQQMRYEFETFAAGTKFSHEMFLESATDMEYAAFLSALALFSKFPFVGGRSAAGHGKVALQYHEFAVNPLLTGGDGRRDIMPTIPAQYDAFLRERRERIVELLSEVS